MRINNNKKEEVKMKAVKLTKTGSYHVKNKKEQTMAVVNKNLDNILWVYKPMYVTFERKVENA